MDHIARIETPLGGMLAAADGEALVFPGQHVLGQVELLVHHGEPHLGELVGGHLRAEP